MPQQISGSTLDGGGGGGGRATNSDALLAQGLIEAMAFNTSVAQAIADIGVAIGQLEDTKNNTVIAIDMAASKGVTSINRARDEALKAIHSAAPQDSWGADNPDFCKPE